MLVQHYLICFAGLEDVACSKEWYQLWGGVGVYEECWWLRLWWVLVASNDLCARESIEKKLGGMCVTWMWDSIHNHFVSPLSPSISFLLILSLSYEEEQEELWCNYERYRTLVQNAFRGISEEKCLKELEIEDMYPETKKKMNKEKAKYGFCCGSYIFLHLQLHPTSLPLPSVLSYAPFLSTLPSSSVPPYFHLIPWIVFWLLLGWLVPKQRLGLTMKGAAEQWHHSLFPEGKAP